MANVVGLGQAVGKAERKARKRDIENSKILTDEEMQQANELQAKANSQGMKLVPERKVKNNSRFVQLNQANLIYLREISYLKTAEKNFLFEIASNVGLLSNCIVDDVYKKSPVPLTQTEIAEVLGKKKQNVNPIIKQLIDKGIIARAETGLDNNNVRAYSLFLNPNIMYSGNRDEVNPTLQAMFKKVPKELKKLPSPMF
ncbi:winged helix-turn-helix transcriptional regulator [Bacillus cereus]|uniref:winged helix-turn-helix transcriptional regulator n=1 Tax=Bacillus cereus TaxID=1396 RepID=UPI002404B874|nr:winged helix-turn-helix transcriptional regulator [Bacillus cereus]MDF9507251.1 winged helix-turn-helix transcriptional regulator [Bacillus cereus]MDF9598155.1 winged helix-turn-helix transcriptional regulator [Bacillus cereus]MDF9610379.1 winged helix-turn-helix transcriptional regulator [Bacillus cereus]MDF9661278.1 winged helix-turn-helix transcriptional regulator [Bacillus cereus]